MTISSRIVWKPMKIDIKAEICGLSIWVIDFIQIKRIYDKLTFVFSIFAMPSRLAGIMSRDSAGETYDRLLNVLD
jgi:hypothetical protein